MPLSAGLGRKCRKAPARGGLAGLYTPAKPRQRKPLFIIRQRQSSTRTSWRGQYIMSSVLPGRLQIQSTRPIALPCAVFAAIKRRAHRASRLGQLTAAVWKTSNAAIHSRFHGQAVWKSSEPSTHYRGSSVGVWSLRPPQGQRLLQPGVLYS